MSWPKVKLKDCCKVVGGATPKRNVPEYWESDDIPWVTPKDVSNLTDKTLLDAPEYISQLGFDKCATYLLPKGSILLTSRAPIGNVAIAGKDMCTNQGFKSLVAGEGVDSTYLYYCMLAHSKHLDALGNGATFKEVSKKVVEEFEIPLPPFEEQKRIATILDKADAIRRKRQQVIQLADDFLRSVFLDMFGDPVTNPKGWEIKTISQCLSDGVIMGIQDGNHGNDHPKVSDFVSNGVPFVAANVVRKGKILFDKCYYLTPNWLDKLRIGFAKPRDVLLTHKGTLGLTAVLDDSYDTYIFSPQTTYYRLNESRILSEYLKAYFDTTYFQRLMEKEGKQSTRAYIGITRQKDLPLMLPPMAEQQKFLKAYKIAISAENKTNGSKLANEYLFNSLSQKAFVILRFISALLILIKQNPCYRKASYLS